MAHPRIRTSGSALCLLGSLVCAACTPGSPIASDGIATQLPERSASASASAAPSASPDARSPIASAAAGEERLLQTIAMQGGPDMPTEAFGSL